MHDELFRDKEEPRASDFDDISTIWRKTEAPQELQVERPVKIKKGNDHLITVFICVVISIFASLAIVAGYDRWFAQKVVAVDIKGYIAQQRDSYLAGKLNDADLRKSFDRLEAAIKAIPKNRVIIMGDAVVRNAETVEP